MTNKFFLLFLHKVKRDHLIQYFYDNKGDFKSYLYFLSENRFVFKKKSILILKTDAIGDYLLFRPYLIYLKNHFKNYKITLVGNIIWKDLAIKLDSDFINQFYWVDKKKMNINSPSKELIKLLLDLTSVRFAYSIYPVYSRENDFGDVFMSYISSKKKITYQGDDVNQTKEDKIFNNSFYTNLISSSSTHDFLKHKEFIEDLIFRKIDIEKIPFNLTSVKNRNETIILCPGSSQMHKIWDLDNWILLIDFIIDLYPEKAIYVLGGDEINDFDNMLSLKYKSSNVISLINKTTLVEVIELISSSIFLITADSMAVHIGIQSNTPTFCIYKGNHYGRFLPYPFGSNFRICMPKIIKNMNTNQRILKYGNNEGENIDLINPDEVYDELNDFLIKNKLK